MTKAVKCTACGLYYNGQVYGECPHCKTKQNGGEPEKKEHIFPDILQPPADTETPNSPSVETDSSNSGSNSNTHRNTMPYSQMPGEEPKEYIDDSLDSDEIAKQNISATLSESDFGKSLKEQVAKSRKTVGKFTSSSGSEATEPTVGWLVCVKGAYYGQSFSLHGGKNKVGRSQEFDIRLLNDESVSRSSVAAIIFDTKEATFSIVPGDSDSHCYLDGEAL